MALAFALAALAGCAYLLFAIRRVRALDTSCALADRVVPIAIFKPLHGLDPGLYENLCSFCEQDYPEFSVLFCVRDANDAAVPVARRVMEAYPHVDCTLVIEDRFNAPNPKVANMMGARTAARGEIFVIADADVRAPKTALRAVAAAFENPRVGAASCLYRGVPLGVDLPSRLGAMHVNEHFLPSVLVATAYASPSFCLGAMMAVRRTAFDEIGGFDAIGGYLGDDFALGRLVTARGYAVALVPQTVACIVEEPTMRAFFRHQLRWARTIRFQAPLGYAFSFVTYPLPFALACVAAARGAIWSDGVLFVTALVRMALHVAVRQKFDLDRADSVTAIVASDILELVVWVCSFFGAGVDWRGSRYRAAQERASRSV